MEPIATEIPPTDNKIEKLSRILRSVAAIILAFAAISFTVQTWDGLNSIQRFFYFLGFSTLIGAIALLMKNVLRDPAGALLAFTLSLAFTPIHFSELAAFIFRESGGIPPPNFPSFLIAVAHSKQEIVLGAIAVMLFCVPIGILAFREMLGATKSIYSYCYLISNLALLIPTRRPEYVLIIGAFVSFLSIITNLFAVSEDKTKAHWYRLAGGLQLIPLIILIGRASLYGYSDFLMCLVWGSISALLFSVAPRLSLKTAGVCRVLSLLGTAIAWKHLMDPLLDASSNSFVINYRLPLHFLPLVLIIFMLSLFAKEQDALFRKIGGAIAVGCVMVQLFTVAALGSAILCVLVSSLVLSLSFTMEEKGLFYAGSLGLAIGLLYNLKYARYFYDLSPWLALGTLGVLLLLISSLVPRYYKEAISRYQELRNRLSAWR